MSTAALAAVLVVLAVSGCGGSEPARHGTAGRTPVVVDTDLSTDDILALLYLAQRDDVDIRAVTVSGTGVVRCPRGAANALALLAYAGHPDVPVACGRPDPLAGFNAFPGAWRDAADAFYGLQLPAARRAQAPGGAEALLRSVLREGGPRVTLLSLAPMTDFAAVLRRDPSLRSRIAAVYAMGGALSVPGNIGPGHEGVEFNLWTDPTAARFVLESGAPVTLVPLDATNHVPITPSWAAALRAHRHASRTAAAAWSLLRRNQTMYSGGQFFWDPLAAAAVTEPDLLRFDERQLAVVTDPGPRNGLIVPAPDGARVRVALGARRAAFERDLLGTLAGGGDAAVPARPPTATLTFNGRRCSYAGPLRLPERSVTFDTVDRSGTGYRLVVGALHEGRTLADLHAAVARTGGRLESSPWFIVSPVGATPPGGRVTWQASVGAVDRHERLALACVDALGRPTFAPVVLAGPR